MGRSKKKPTKVEVCGESCTLYVAVAVVSKLLGVSRHAAATRIVKQREDAVKQAKAAAAAAAAVAGVAPASRIAVSSKPSFHEMKVCLPVLVSPLCAVGCRHCCLSSISCVCGHCAAFRVAAVFPCVQALFSALGFEVSPKLSSSDKDAHNVRQALSQPGADDVVIVAGQFNFAYCPELAPAHIEVLPVFVSPPAPSACALAIRDLEERLDHAKKLGIPPEACAGDQARLQTMRADADAAAAAGGAAGHSINELHMLAIVDRNIVDVNLRACRPKDSPFTVPAAFAFNDTRWKSDKNGQLRICNDSKGRKGPLASISRVYKVSLPAPQ